MLVQVFYNNVLSLPICLPLAWFRGELPAVFDDPLLHGALPPPLPSRHASSWAAVAAGPDAKSFMCCALFSGVVGFVLNLASFWCNQVRGPLPALSPPLRLTDALAASVELGDDVRGGWSAEQDPAAAARGAALLQRHHRPAVVRAPAFRPVLPFLSSLAELRCVWAGCTSRCRCAAASSTRT